MVIEWLRRVRYRVQQFFAALHAHVTPAEVAALHGVLPAAGLALFCRMPVADQRHSLDVCAALRQQGYADPDLPPRCCTTWPRRDTFTSGIAWRWCC